MNPKLVIVLFVALLTAFGMWYDNTYISRPPQQQRQTSGPAPEFTHTPLGHTAAVSSGSLKGKVVLLNFWASWCVPCQVEFPLLIELTEQFPDTLVLLAVSSDEKPEHMTHFLRVMENRLGKVFNAPNLHFVWDENKHITQDIFRTFRYPETIIIDPEGNMKGKIIGAITPEYHKEIQAFIAEIAGK